MDLIAIRMPPSARSWTPTHRRRWCRRSWSRPPPPPAAASEYTILKGDTFSTIAQKFGVTRQGASGGKSKRGSDQVADREEDCDSGPARRRRAASGVPPVAVAPLVDGGGLYKVKSGDTLSKIATEHHTTVKAIQSANNLTDSRIKVGQTIEDAGQVADD